MKDVSYVVDSATFHKLSSATEFYRVAKSTLGDANFDLRKWISNNFELNKYVHSKNNGNMDLTELNNYQKALGLQSQLSTDKIMFKLLAYLLCFPVNFAKFIRTPFLQNTSRRLLLTNEYVLNISV